MLMIYGKYKTEKRYSPMDMNSGLPVKNKFMQPCTKILKRTPLQSP